VRVDLSGACNPRATPSRSCLGSNVAWSLSTKRQKDDAVMLDIAGRRADFHALHKEGYFLLPTAWDVPSAKRLEAP
jgi:hypothetical protein